ncbi:MAG: membrane protein insertase YidC [Tannerellaceae bacterium]|nr:membrane protein insertase YidC [Tannerellaceae bacterium]
MDKNTVIGFLLIGVVLIAFTWLNQPSPEQLEAQRRYYDSIAAVEQARILEEETAGQLAENRVADEFTALSDSAKAAQLETAFGGFAQAMSGTEETVTLENELVEVRISTKGGHITSVRLKNFQTYDKQPLVLFEGNESRFEYRLVTATNRILNTGELYFTPVRQGTNSVTMRLDAGEGSSLDFTYTLRPDDYMIDYSIQAQGLNGVLNPSTTTLDLNWEQVIRQQEKGRKFENQHSGLYYKTADKVDNLSELKDQNKQVSDRLRWVAYKDKFFSSVLITDKEHGFESTTLESRLQAEDSPYLKTMRTVTSIPFDLQGRQSSDLTFYFGPNRYNLLRAYDKGIASSDKLELDRLVPLGASVFRWINKYFIIPIFDFLGKYITSYGLIIFLLTLIVKLILFPLTYKSYMSSAKMRVLRPQVEEINAQYPGQEKAMERQKATMELYNRAGASPMSGCLPMLLQMPILIAMYMFFPSAIELRNQSFLWAQDLSTYDAIVSWNAYIPIITPYFGNHISLFCLLMTLTNIVYTKYNMEMTNTGQQQMPGMKMMMYMMPLMFLVFFNQNASGLSYYYFISTLITIIQTITFRYVINEDKLLAKLEENKKRPVKKSSFMRRLEEAQKAQQTQLEKQKQQQQQQREQRKKR